MGLNLGPLLRLVPWWTWLAAGLFAWGWWGNHRLESVKQEAAREAHRLDNRRASITQEVQSAHLKKVQSLSRGDAAVRAELADVRVQLDLISREAAGAQAAERANAERVRALSVLLEESGGLLSEAHERVGALAAQLGSLQTWTDRVCVKNQ